MQMARPIGKYRNLRTKLRLKRQAPTALRHQIHHCKAISLLYGDTRDVATALSQGKQLTNISNVCSSGAASFLAPPETHAPRLSVPPPHPLHASHYARLHPRISHTGSTPAGRGRGEPGAAAAAVQPVHAFLRPDRAPARHTVRCADLRCRCRCLDFLLSLTIAGIQPRPGPAGSVTAPIPPQPPHPTPPA